jgi:uncharacterized protein YbjT (DUF2867 family)
MNEGTAVVIGASGLIGDHLVELMLNDDYFLAVRVLVRKKLALNHAKLEQQIVNFNDINDYTNKFGNGNSIFCCVGTTTKKVNGDITAYTKVDFDIPYNAAKIGISKNYKKFLIVSSVGANEMSANFYLKLKGKIENALKQFEFNSISIFRPGQLLGKRNEYRRGENILQNVTKFMSHFLFLGLKKYHSIKAKDVAKAMIAAGKKDDSGVFIFEYNGIKKLLSNA